MENFNNNTEVFTENNFENIVAEMYESHIKSFLNGLEEELTKLAEILEEEDGWVENEIELKKQYFDENRDLIGMVRNITNNFFVKFPGAWYRDLGDKAVGDKKEMFEDIDRLIIDNKYSDSDLLLISNQELEGEDNEKRSKIIMEVYLGMLDKGYSRDVLIS